MDNLYFELHKGVKIKRRYDLNVIMRKRNGDEAAEWACAWDEASSWENNKKCFPSLDGLGRMSEPQLLQLSKRQRHTSEYVPYETIYYEIILLMPCVFARASTAEHMFKHVQARLYIRVNMPHPLIYNFVQTALKSNLTLKEV